MVGALYPVGDLCLLASVAWLAFAPGRRNRSVRLLLGFAGMTLVLDVAYALGTNHHWTGVMKLVDASYPLAYLLLGLALHDPTVAQVTEPVHHLVQRTNPVRLALIGATLALVTAMTALADSLGFTLLAEGIERTTQRDTLVELGVPYGQGFLFARALPPVEARAFIQSFGTVDGSVEVHHSSVH